jgi:hypothetical protein
MSQYDECSMNKACGCLFTASSSDTAICDLLWVTCSELVSCGPLNNVCYEPNHVCVHHPRCHSHPVCYPLSMNNRQICPPITSKRIKTESLFLHDR